MPKAQATDKLARAAKLHAEYEKQPAKLDKFFDSKFSLSYKYGEERGFCQFIFLNLLRNKRIIESILSRFLRKRPKALLFSLLKCAAAEILASPPEKTAQIAHAWVQCCKERFSKPEAAMANAVLRKFAPEYEKAKLSAKSLEDFALLYSHPLWLAKSWKSRFGEGKAVEIMRQNSKPAGVFLRVSPSQEAAEIFKKYSEFFEACAVEGFFRLKGGAFDKISPLLNSPFFYIQDPATSFAPALLNPKGGEKILDLCAAPGGKSRILADLALKSGKDLAKTSLVSVDLPGERFELLKQNLSKIGFLNARAVSADIIKGELAGALKRESLPEKYDAVFLDAPCSNTGVLRRRPDARYRLSPADISACAEIQLRLILEAAKFLKPNGRLAYSTCSIDPLENEEAPKRAAALLPNLEIRQMKTIFPDDSLDGAGMCLFAPRL